MKRSCAVCLRNGLVSKPAIARVRATVEGGDGKLEEFEGNICARHLDDLEHDGQIHDRQMIDAKETR